MTGIPAPLAAAAAAAAPSASAAAVSLTDAMAFGGPAPEIINGRLCMVAVVAALAAEASSHESVLRQLADQPTLVSIFAVLIAAGSLVPLMEGRGPSKSGFWTSAAEQLNGRAAMIGFASLLVTEKVIGHALL